MNKNENFESTFVSLDLSEFSSGPTSTESASAQLMKLKQKEALHKQNEEEEEQIIQIGAANRARDALERLKTKQKNHGQENDVTNVFHDTILSMHGNDYAGARKNVGTGMTKAQRKNSSRVRKIKTDQSKGTKKGFAKKSRRSKF
mmetsp:Transcript_7535/g.8684  ORF Transcript_7535/g.8684 Transcript_7535/m.8684 type:complete len:145 (-) Transcript_7535:91-525(-)|eukprot:CAMPEP_0204648464 /NCGR_PEP_ID=MMETSP0718-20130828/7831_1 /ASSEMBLY_ACC=CAM_ASM_000674 /TAXON_ID=230516 /ORGANISM="Chaetoceros curvisetus" /LENGTH=144 /DNA_ID=CAMNT_0051671301 /DNA_START=140 /DNA_END=574 /DNA_ORIENTATION=+